MVTDGYDTLWCLRQFQMMALGGTWGVPRSGLIFQKDKLDPPTLKLIGNMPWLPEMEGTVSEDELKEIQRADLELIREKFQTAGITIEGEL